MPFCTLIGVVSQFIVYTFVRLVFYLLCKITFQLPWEWVCAPGHWMLCEVMWPLWLSRANPSNLCVIWLHKSPLVWCWAGRRYDAGNNWLWGKRDCAGGYSGDTLNMIPSLILDRGTALPIISKNISLYYNEMQWCVVQTSIFPNGPKWMFQCVSTF